MQYSTPTRTPSKRLSYVKLEIASTTPKPTKVLKHSSRLSILRTPQEIHLSGKDIQKSVKAQCPTVDTDRLKKRQFKIAGPKESLVVEYSPEVSSVERKCDFLYRMKGDKQPLVAKQIDTSSQL